MKTQRESNPTEFGLLDLDLVPDTSGEDRDKYLEKLAKQIMPKSNVGDNYFYHRGRSALTGYLHFLVSKLRDRTDAKRYDGIPSPFLAKQPSIEMLAYYLVENSKSVLRDRYLDNPEKEMIKEILEEAKEHKYSPRCVVEFQNLFDYAEMERAKVLRAMEKAVLLCVDTEELAMEEMKSKFFTMDSRVANIESILQTIARKLA